MPVWLDRHTGFALEKGFVGFNVLHTKGLFSKGSWAYYLLLASAIGVAGVSASLISIQDVNLQIILGGIGLAVGLIFIAFLIKKPEFGLPILVFVTFTRAPEVIPGLRGLPSLSTAFALFLLVVIIFRRIYFKESIENWHRQVIFFGVFGLIVLASLLYAEDQESVRLALADFFPDITIAIVIAILCRGARELRMVVWGLLAAGILLGTLTTIQQLTGNFTNSYLGFSQVDISHIVGLVDDYRVIGPGLDPNSYGMYLVLLIPLAIDRVWNERKGFLRIAALWCFLVVSLTIMLTFSRAAFLTLAIVIILFFIQHPPKIRTFLMWVILGIVLLFLAPARYTERLATLLDFVRDSELAENGGGAGIRQAALSEPSFKGRLSENLVGLQMAADHPIIGVGYTNFEYYYQSYSRVLGLDSRREGRGAHNLYLQIAAEMGIFGLILLGASQIWVIKGLREARNKFRLASLNQEAYMVTAFMISLAGFLFASIFRHMTYPRYIWLFYGILLAIPYISKVELEKFLLKKRPLQQGGKK